MKYVFPKDFEWGTATASYQVEGGWDADGKGESIWDRFTHTPGKTYNKQTGDISCDHYHKYKQDIDLMKKLKLNASRFSIAWTRILPNGTGKINQKGLDFYDRLVDKMLKEGITPFITLYHWDLPQKLEDKGGWRKKDTAYVFADYAKVIVSHLSDRVQNWMTLNEPTVVVDCGYKDGVHAPGAKEPNKVLNQISHNLLLAHGLGVQAVRAYSKGDCEVGLAHASSVKVPKTLSKKDMEATRYIWDKHNLWWFEPVFNGKYPEELWKEQGKDVPKITDEEMRVISSPLDFLGLNTYFADIIEYDKKNKYKVVPYRGVRTTYGWGIIPESIYWGLKIPAQKYGIKKFYITENGVALTDIVTHDGKVHDYNRIDFLKNYLKSLHKAIKDGINVKGYFVWSFMDNFEWNGGYSQRFGLVYTDYSTLKRIPKDSAYFYKGVIKNNGVVEETIK